MTRRRCAAGVALAVALAACAPSVTTPSVSSVAGTHPPPAPHHASLNTCPGAAPLASLPVLAHIAGDPDDVTVDADGVLWVSDRNGDRILQLSPQGATLHSFVDPNGPEGIVLLSDGTVVVAQQVPDRLDVLHPGSGTFSTWLQLGATSSPTDGVDGISLDNDTVLVPDSAHGRLLAVALAADDSAGSPTVLATGLGRPVAALRASSGAYLVALENQPGLAVVQAGSGRSTAVVHVDSLDDLAMSGGLVYATDLSDQSLIAVDPVSGEMRTLVTGAPAPQGLALTPDGKQLLLVDSTAQVLVRLQLC